MGKRVSIKHKRKEAPEWVFNWRQPGNSGLAKWLAVLVTGGLFSLLLTGVQIRLSSPVKWAAPKAMAIYVGHDAEGRALALRAREEGPFPSRFLPSQWEGTAALEQAVFGAARWTPPPYVPVLRDLPEEAVTPARLAASGPVPERWPAREHLHRVRGQLASRAALDIHHAIGEKQARAPADVRQPDRHPSLRAPEGAQPIWLVNCAMSK